MADIVARLTHWLPAFVALLAAAAFAVLMLRPASAQADAIPRPRMDVIDYACDDRGGVKELSIAVDGPGLVHLHWDNAKICGQPA